MKTTNEILSDMYAIVKASPIDALSGGVYKKTRPNDSELEDCIISLISGTKMKFVQNGSVYIKIFYKDLFINNTYGEDSVNGQAKESLLINLSETILHKTGYFFDVQSREVYTEAAPEIHQHYAILKMNFKNLN